MSNNLKYTLQKHKGKFWVGGSILATAVVATVVWMNISDNSPFSFQKESISHLAEHVITGTKEGQIKMVNVSNNQIVATMEMHDKNNYLFYKDRIHEMFYAYNGSKLVVFSEKDGTLLSSEFTENLIEIDKPTRFAYDGKLLTVYSKENQKVSVVDIEENKVVLESTEKEEVVDILPVLNDIFFLTKTDLVKVTEDGIERIELGSELLSIQEDKGKLLVHSAFGAEKGENVLFDINSETLEIDSLQKTGSPNSVVLAKDDGEEFYLAGDFVRTDTSNHYSFNRYKIGVEGLTKDNLEVTVPVGDEKILMDYSNSIVDNEFIYVHDDDSLKIFDIKSQEILHDVPVDVDFAMPVLYEKGDKHE